MNPFTRLPNEIIDAIFIHLRPDEVWTTQQCSASTERVLDPHLRTRRHAIDCLMWWACETGNNQAVRKAVSLGADVSILRVLSVRPSEFSTVFCASHHLDTVNLLLDLGARFDIDFEGFSGWRREESERKLNPEFFQLCSDRGVTDQFADFQKRIDYCLFLVIDLWSDMKDNAEGLERISMLLELGANSVTIAHDGAIVSTLSYLIKCLHSGYECPTASWYLTVLKLLLSKRPDLNAPSLEMTGRFLKDPSVLISWDMCVCPIAAAVESMAFVGTTEIMDMLLEAGARLDLPVHTCFQPLAMYAFSIKTHDGPGYEYLASHGASFKPVWHPEESVDDQASIPIFSLCREFRDWGISSSGGALLLEDGIFGTIKLFIERGAVKKVGLRFIKNVLRLITDEEIDDDEQPAVIKRYHILLKLILQDDNLNPNNPGECHELISEIADQALANTPGLGQLMRFSNIMDPILVALLLQKGARLRTRRLTKDVRDYVVLELQRNPYNIRIDI